MNIGDDRIPPRFEGGKDRLAYLLAEYKIGVYLAAAAGLVLVLTGRLGIPQLPPWATTALRGMALGILPAMILSNELIVKKFMPDPRQRVIEWVPDEDGNTIRCEPWRVPRNQWQEREHLKGMPALEPDGQIDAIVTSFEWDQATDQIRVRGVNQEVADPADVQSSNGQLHAIYNELLDDRRELVHLQSTLSLRQHEIEAKVVNELVAAVEHGMAFSPASDEVSGEYWSEHTDAQAERTDARSINMDRDMSQTQPAATDGGQNSEQ